MAKAGRAEKRANDEAKPASGLQAHFTRKYRLGSLEAKLAVQVVEHYRKSHDGGGRDIGTYLRKELKDAWLQVSPKDAQKITSILAKWPRGAVRTVAGIAAKKKSVKPLYAMATRIDSAAMKFRAKEERYWSRRNAQERADEEARSAVRAPFKRRETKVPYLPNGGLALNPEIDPALFDRTIPEHWWSGKRG